MSVCPVFHLLQLSLTWLVNSSILVGEEPLMALRHKRLTLALAQRRGGRPPRRVPQTRPPCRMATECFDVCGSGIRLITSKWMGGSVSRDDSTRSTLVDEKTKWIDTAEVIEKKGKIPVTGRYCTSRLLKDDYQLASKVLGSGMSGPVQLATSRGGDGEKCAVKSFKKHGLSEKRRGDLKNEAKKKAIIEVNCLSQAIDMAGRASFGGTCDFDFQPVRLHGKEAMFGEKRMSVQREQLAGKLSRSCRINEGRPSLLASTALTGESTYHFRHKGAPAISHSVADRNEVVEKNSKAIQHFCVVGTPRDKTRRVSEVASTKAPVVDSKALSAEIDSVVMELRNLIAGDTEHSLNPGMVKSNTTEVRKDDDEEEGQSLHAKLLRYRYVRKIEAPPPPLEPLEGSYLKTPREVDKMEKNLQTFRRSYSPGLGGREML
eukprot:s55_g23.t1